MSIYDLNRPVADNVTAIINERGFKQHSIAKMIGYSAQEFNDMLKGRRLIKISDIPQLSAALNVSVNELFRSNQELA